MSGGPFIVRAQGSRRGQVSATCLKPTAWSGRALPELRPGGAGERNRAPERGAFAGTSGKTPPCLSRRRHTRLPWIRGGDLAGWTRRLVIAYRSKRRASNLAIEPWTEVAQATRLAPRSTATTCPSGGHTHTQKKMLSRLPLSRSTHRRQGQALHAGREGGRHLGMWGAGDTRTGTHTHARDAVLKSRVKREKWTVPTPHTHTPRPPLLTTPHPQRPPCAPPAPSLPPWPSWLSPSWQAASPLPPRRATGLSPTR